MNTTPHDRRIVPLAPRDWRAWLDPVAPTTGILVAGAAGTLAVERVN